MVVPVADNAYSRMSKIGQHNLVTHSI